MSQTNLNPDAAGSDNTGAPQPDQAPSRAEFAALLDKSFAKQSAVEGSVVYGHVTAIENDYAIVDIGMKTEGRIALREFGSPQNKDAPRIGEEVEVYLERIENAQGEALLSREKARREEVWVQLEDAFKAERPVKGSIWTRVKGGFTVDLNGATAFLPGSQVDVMPMRDVSHLMDTALDFQIIKMDRRRGNIVVSRRVLMQEKTQKQREEAIKNIQQGAVMEGVVKNITDYGAFVDLGGIDGLLHVTDIAWRRIHHPSEVLKVGEKMKVQIIKINPETQRISLGLKQMEGDPWEGVQARYQSGQRVKGVITNITDYGAFAKLEDGIEGLIHISEMSWGKKVQHPSRVVEAGQELEVMVLEVNSDKRRISLGLKQCGDNPWETFAAQSPVGSEVSGAVKNITEFGMFVGLADDIDGMVHMSDLSWTENGEQALAQYEKGQEVKAIVLEIDVKRGRVGLGVKQLDADPLEGGDEWRKGAVLTCTVTGVQEGGIEVSVGEKGLTSFIRRSELSRERADQRPQRFAAGDKVDAMLTALNKKTRRMTLSIKALEISQEKEAIKHYGSSDSGASLGDILGEALGQNDQAADGKADKSEAKEEKEEKEAKPPEAADAKQEADAKQKDAAPQDAKEEDAKPQEEKEKDAAAAETAAEKSAADKPTAGAHDKV